MSKSSSTDNKMAIKKTIQKKSTKQSILSDTLSKRNYKTVAEFIEELKKLPQDAAVISASDDEGNHYRKPFFAPSAFWIKNINDNIIDQVHSEKHDDDTIQVVVIN